MPGVWGCWRYRARLLLSMSGDPARDVPLLFSSLIPIPGRVVPIPSLAFFLTGLLLTGLFPTGRLTHQGRPARNFCMRFEQSTALKSAPGPLGWFQGA